MAETAAQEKTEKATPRRRRDARKKGQVAQSKEISSVLILMTTMGVFYFAGSWMFYNFSGIFTGIYENIGTMPLNNASEAEIILHTVFDYLFSILVPIFFPIRRGPKPRENFSTPTPDFSSHAFFWNSSRGVNGSPSGK